jgi:two-component system, NtrC family, sensor kinase
MTARAFDVGRQTDDRGELGSGPVRLPVDLATAYSSLLQMTAALPLEAGPAQVARRAVDALAAVLPERAIGVCLVVSSTDAPLVELFLPDGVPSPGRDPTRLFPELDGEWVVGLPDLPGSTLHLATIGAPLEEDSGEHTVVVHAAALLSRSVRAAVALEHAKPPSATVAELRAQLIQAEKLATLGQIVAGVVHELANPVTSIVACTDYLLRKTDHPVPDEKDQLKRISVAADRILKFSRDLVAYARPASEQPAAVAIHEVITQAHAFSQHELERHGIAFSPDFDAGAPPILGQAGPLTQVFVNLFTNAAHAMSGNGGRLSVRTRVDGASPLLSVEVTDTGVGIPADTLCKVFEPFFTTKEPGRGTGLGLSIVKEIVQAHGGSVTVASTPGEGTTFTVTLPLFTRAAS